MPCHCCPDKDAYFEILKRYLVPFQEEALVPEEAYILYDMSGAKYYVLHNNYSSFVTLYFSNPKSSHLVMDLNYANVHTLCLDIDNHSNDPPQVIDSYISNVLLDKLKYFFTNVTVIVARKMGGGAGLHVILPEIKISNDDYHFFCEALKDHLNFQNFALDIPLSFNLPFTKKVDQVPFYVPALIALLCEDGIFEIQPLKHENTISATVVTQRSVLKRRKKLASTAYYHFINQAPANRNQMLLNLMLPVNTCNTFKKHELVLNTLITDQQQSEQPLAVIEMRIQQQTSVKYIYKDIGFNLKDGQIRTVYGFLKIQIPRIQNVESQNPAIKHWFKRLSEKMIPTRADIFQEINMQLKEDNFTMLEDDHPIRTIMSYNNGAFFIPMFYSLFNRLDVSSERLCEELLACLENEAFEPLIRRLAQLDSNLIKTAAQDFSYYTILYCSGNMKESELSPIETIDFILENSKFVFTPDMNVEKMVTLMSHIINAYFPIRKLRDKRYFWNSFQRQWMTCSGEEMKNIYGLLSDKIVAFFNRNNEGRKPPCTSYNLREKCFNINSFNSVMKENNKSFKLDYRKWFLRTHDGVLDLLTGNIGQAVPEHFLSDKCIMSERPIVRSLEQHRVFSLLWTREFFERYLSRLKEYNMDYMVTLRDMTEQYGDHRMLLEAYVHLCKFFRFDFDEMLCFLYAIASCLVATNYGKKIFLLQGEKDNGKSRMIKILKLIFERYAISVDQDVFASGRKSETKPEIARYFLEVRLLLCEELAGNVNQNYLKLLSSDSLVSCRDLYQSPVSGIPTMKMYFSTNKPPSVITTQAFRERIVVFNFGAKFLAIQNMSVGEQIELGIFERDFNEKELPDTAYGFFMHMYYLHMDNFSKTDGYLEYPPIPQSLLDFKEEYLRNTDIYKQFKLILDVQVVPNEMTTIQDLQTAVRHFLKVTRNTTTISDIDIMKRFDEEFAKYRCYADDSDFSTDSEDEEPKTKKQKPEKTEEEKNLTLQYVNVAIKNIRRYH